MTQVYSNTVGETKQADDFISELTAEELAEVLTMEDPDKGTVPDEAPGFRLSRELQQNIVSLIVNGHERDYLAHVSPKHFHDESHKLIVTIAQEMKAKCGSVPGQAAMVNEIRTRLNQKKTKTDIIADYVGEYAACRSYYLPGVVDEAYLKRQIEDFTRVQAVREAYNELAKAIADPKADIKTTIGEMMATLAKARELGGGGRQRKAIADKDVDDQPDPLPLIESLVDQESMAVIFGDTNLGKSFVALDAANSIARGTPFLNHFKVHTALPVAYIYAEGRRGLKKRVHAWRKKREQTASENICFLPYRFVLNDEAGTEVSELLASATLALGREPKVLFVDTLAKNMQGNESDNEDMSSLVNKLTDLVNEKGMTIFLVHHTGKDLSKGARGGYSLKCGIDTEIEIAARDERSIRLINPKARDGEKLADFILSKEKITVGFMPDHTPITSLVFNYSHSIDTIEPGTGEKVSGDESKPILAVLTEQETTATAIASQLGANRREVNRILGILRDTARVGWRQVEEKNGVKGYRYWKTSVSIDDIIKPAA